MPELPEVETVRRGLAATFVGDEIAAVDLHRPDLRFPFPPRFAARLAGQTVRAVDRRAKYLLIRLESGMTLLVHLGMSGSLRIRNGQHGAADSATFGMLYRGAGKNPTHDHVVIRFGSGRDLVYNDPRRFGFMDLGHKAEFDAGRFHRLGPEPTRDSLTANDLAARIDGRVTSIKSALLDQRIVAGLGNIYVCEALWRARIRPDRGAGALVSRSGRPTAELTRLTKAIHDVLDEAIALGGASLRDHVAPSGAIGAFQTRFAVYDREGTPCPRARCRGTVSRIVQGGRSTFLCATCQR